MLCMSLDMIYISKRAISFHLSIFIKAVSWSYKYAAPKKDEKAKL